jgi:hypothetical protein
MHVAQQTRGGSRGGGEPPQNWKKYDFSHKKHDFWA